MERNLSFCAVYEVCLHPIAFQNKCCNRKSFKGPSVVSFLIVKNVSAVWIHHELCAVYGQTISGFVCLKVRIREWQAICKSMMISFRKFKKRCVKISILESLNFLFPQISWTVFYGVVIENLG